MRYPAAETAQKRENILDEAAKLFRERGFDGVGVAEIMQAVGLTHGTFYAHFASKEALAAEALERAFAQSDRSLFRKRKANEDMRERFLDRYLSRAHRDHPGEGCPLGALGSEDAKTEAVRDTFTEQLSHMIGRLEQALSESKKDEASRAETIAMLCTAVGALTMARAVNDQTLSNEILDSARKHLG